MRRRTALSRSLNGSCFTGEEHLARCISACILTSFACRRSAEKTVGIWLQRLKDLVAPKRLLLLYLANGTRRPIEYVRSHDADTNLSRGCPAVQDSAQRRLRDRLLSSRPSLPSFVLKGLPNTSIDHRGSYGSRVQRRYPRRSAKATSCYRSLASAQDLRCLCSGQHRA